MCLAGAARPLLLKYTLGNFGSFLVLVARLLLEIWINCSNRPNVVFFLHLDALMAKFGIQMISSTEPCRQGHRNFNYVSRSFSISGGEREHGLNV